MRQKISFSLNNKWSLFLVALIFKTIFLLLFGTIEINNNELQIYSLSGDAEDYLAPVENLILNGEYKTDSGEFALRSPGYLPIYLLPRIFLSKNSALNLVVIIQLLLSAMSCVTLSRIARMITKNTRISLIVFWLFVLSSYVSVWNGVIITESIAASMFIFSIYFMFKGLKKSSKTLLMLAGIFISWACFLRPYLLPIYGIFGLFFLQYEKLRIQFSKLILLFGILCLPFAILETIWVTRNYLAMEKLVLIQTRITYNDGQKFSENNPIVNSIADFSKSFGGDHCYWNPTSPGYWLLNENCPYIKTPGSLFPNALYSDEYNFEDLKMIRENLIANNSITKEVNTQVEKSAILQLKRIHDSYKENSPFHFYISSRIIHLKEFLFHSGVYNHDLHAFDSDLLEKVLKSFYAVLYLLIIILGLISAIWQLFKTNSHEIKLMAWIAIYIVILFPFVFKMHEYRFSVLAFPFFTILAGSLLNSITEKFIFSNHQKPEISANSDQNG